MVALDTAAERATTQRRLAWNRHLKSAAVVGGFVLFSGWCFNGTIIQDTDWARIGGADGVLGSAARYLSLDLGLLPQLVIPTIETFMVACVGTLFGCFFSLPVAWFGAANVTPSRYILYPIGRFLMVLSRSVHEIVWALIFVSAVGLERARKIRFGNPMDPDTDLGTVVHARAAEMFERRVEAAASAGANVLYNPGRDGALLPPIVVDHVPHESELVMEETFGPVIPVIRVPDEDEAVCKISNSTAFGLSAGVCTNDFRRMQSYISRLDVGTVNIWEVPGYRIEMSPFGGIKDSGNGYKEGIIEAMKSYTNVKTFSLPWS